MATTNKSTRKKPAKVSKASKASKTSQKTSVKLKKADVKSVKAVLTPLERIKSMHISLTLMYLVFAGLVIGFVKTVASSVTLGLQTKDEFGSGVNVVLGPSSEVLYNIEPKYVLVAALVVSALGSLLLATKVRKRYEKTLTAGISGFRWVLMGVSAALLIEFVNLLAGVNDIAVLKISSGLIVITTMLAWIAERDNVGSARPKWLAFGLSLFTGAFAWLPLLGSLIGTSVYGMERFGWHVYALAGVTLLGFTGFAVNQYLQIRGRGTKKDYTKVEETYLRIGMLTKFAVVLVALLALQ